MERGWGEGDRERGAIPCLSTYALINKERKSKSKSKSKNGGRRD